MRLALLLLLTACGPKDIRTYDNSLFQLASGVSAKEMCTCLFVAEQPEAFCDEWTRVSPNVATHKVDWERKSVRSRALTMGRTVAVFQDTETGCVIQRD